MIKRSRRKRPKTSHDQPIPLWETEAERLHSLVQQTPDPETLVKLTESVTAIQAGIEALDDEAERATEYTKHRKLIPNAFTCTAIRPDLMAAERLVDGVRESPSRFVLRSLLYPSERILAIGRSLQIDIWIKQPRRSTCEALFRAFQSGELDAESFLARFREHAMGLHGRQLDPYIVQALLGMRVSGREILLPGNMQHLAHLGEHEIAEVILARAKKLKRRDDNGTRDLVKVLAPGQQKVGGTCDAMALVVDRMWPDSDGDEKDGARPRTLRPYVEVACKAPEIAYLSEIGELFASPEANEGTIAAAIFRAAGRDQLQRIGRKAGLTRKESRFLHRRALGTVTKRNDESLWKALNAKMPRIRQGLEGVRFGQIV